MNELGLQNVNSVQIKCRELREDDGPNVVELLTAGFAPYRSRGFWKTAFQRLACRDAPADVPRFGLGLEADGELVGVLLLIVSDMVQKGSPVRRCNVSSFYVQERFRPFASMLVSRALRQDRFVTINVTPAPHTWAMLEAQGYTRYSSGRIMAFPALAWRGSGARVRRFEATSEQADLPAHEFALLRDHAGWGCVAVICTTPAGTVPFVFGRRKRRGIRYAYLLYARSVAAFETHARALGLFLLRHGIGFVVIDADDELSGVPGRFKPDFPKFVRGGEAPLAIDLAYTERAIFAV